MRVVIDEDVYRKVMFWVDRARSQEVSGLGNVVVDEKNGVMRVVSAMLLPQKNQATHTEIDADAVAKAMFQNKDSPGELKWWWHSHVQMGVFWSGTDTTTIREWGDNGWVLATVFNQKREIRSAFYSKDGQRTPLGSTALFLDEIKTEIVGQTINSEEWEKSYLDNVVNYKPVYRYNGTGYLSRTQTTSTSGNDSATKPALAALVNMAQLPEKRPIGITKREWKQVKTLRRSVGKDQGLEADGPKLVHDARDRSSKKLVLASDCDAYGFTAAERTQLAEQGYDIHTVDMLINEDFTGEEIMVLAMEMPLADLRQMMAYGAYDAADIMQYVYQMMEYKDDQAALHSDDVPSVEPPAELKGNAYGYDE